MALFQAELRGTNRRIDFAIFQRETVGGYEASDSNTDMSSV